MDHRNPPHNSDTGVFFFSILSELGNNDAFIVDDQGSDTGSESFAISRERSISAPDVYRSRIISGNAPLVSAYYTYL